MDTRYARPFPACLALLLMASLLQAQQAQLPPLPQNDVVNARARDSHDGLTVACDPITDAGRAKEIFGKKHPVEAGLLAVKVIFTNDNAQALRLSPDSFRLVLESRGSGSRQRLRPMTFDEAVTAIANPDPPEMKQRKVGPAGIPLPRRQQARGKDWDKVAATVRSLTFEMNVIPPLATVRGYVFFDMGHRYDLLDGATLVVTDLVNQVTGRPLLYYEMLVVPPPPVPPPPPDRP